MGLWERRSPLSDEPRWMAAIGRYSESRAHTHMAIAGGCHGGGPRAADI